MWNESGDLLPDSNESRVCVKEMCRVLPLNSFMHGLIDQRRSIDLLNMLTCPMLLNLPGVLNTGLCIKESKLWFSIQSKLEEA